MLDLTGRAPDWPRPLRRSWGEALAAAAQAPDGMRTPPWGGLPTLRAALGGLVDAPEPFVTAGARAVVPAFAALGRRVVLESPTFSGIPRTFARCGADPVLAAPDAALAAADPPHRHLLWLTSPGRNPDGWSLGPELAARLGEFTAAGGVVVLNETYRWFGGPAPHVPGAYRVGSFSKLAGGGARLGWVTGPVFEPLAAHLRSATPPTAWQAAWARFAAAGGVRELAGRARAVADLTRGAAHLLAADPADADRIAGASLLVRVPGGDPLAVLRAAGIAAGAGPDFAAPSDVARLSFLGCGTDCDHDSALRRARELGVELGAPPHDPERTARR